MPSSCNNFSYIICLAGRHIKLAIYSLIYSWSWSVGPLSSRLVRKWLHTGLSQVPYWDNIILKVSEHFHIHIC